MIKNVLVTLCIFFCALAIFYRPVLLKNRLPIPADTIIGLYNPFRDFYSAQYPNGIPYKNFLITDPVRQQYPWKWLTISAEKIISLPLWNPYVMAGTPLLASFQNGSFSPFNILFMFLPFEYGWSLLIFLQQFLSALFIYFYLKNIKLSKTASILGGFIYVFSGFTIAWLEWGNIIQTSLWLPLILLAIDKIILSDAASNTKLNVQKMTKVYDNQILNWSVIFLFALIASFFAGHLQTFIYLSLVSLIYMFIRLWQIGRNNKKIYLFIFLGICFLIVTSIQWLPTWQYLHLSARSIDLAGNWQQDGWFLPWQNLIQFFVPDYFGNPATLNYWGIWNYGEFIGYIGVIPMIFVLYAMLIKKDKNTIIFSVFAGVSLLLALPDFLSVIPFRLNIPFLSTAQPTRLLFIVDLSLSILAAIGIDSFLKFKNKKNIYIPISIIACIFAVIWIYTFAAAKSAHPDVQNHLLIAKHNLYIPSIVFAGGSFFLFGASLMKKKKLYVIFFAIVVMLLFFDAVRFADKFIPFTDKTYLYPVTNTIAYLQKNIGISRYITTDSQILPPNFSIMYHLQTLDGYDPLYLQQYGEFIAASERKKPDIHAPFGFNRIITPHTIDSRLIDLSGVKYILSLEDINNKKFKEVFQEGKTKVYENTNSFPRIFFVKNILRAENKNDAVQKLFDQKINLKNTAIVENLKNTADTATLDTGKIMNILYSENTISFDTTTNGNAFLVLTDSFYPTWKAKICEQGNKCKSVDIYITDFNFRGIFLPEGKYHVTFYQSLI